MPENFGFIKKYRSSKAKEMKRKHTSAFLILDTLAENAKRDNSGNPLLEIGEGIITAEECGVSSQQFETGIKFLELNEQVEVIHRGRKDKNSKLLARIKPESKTDSSRINLLNTSRINGTVLKLIDSSIYDINEDHTPNHIPNQKRIHPESHPEFTPNKQETKKQRNQEDKETTTPKPPNESKPKESEVAVVAVCSFELDEQKRAINNKQQANSQSKCPIIYDQINNQEDTSKKQQIICQGSSFVNVGNLATEIVGEEISFDGLSLTSEDKNTLLKFPIQRLKSAIKWVKSGVEIKKTHMHAIMWHCNHPNPPLSKQEQEDKNNQNQRENKNIMKDLILQCSKALHYQKDILKKKVYFSPINNHLRIGFSDNFEDISLFEDPKIFYQCVENALRKRDLWVNPKIEPLPINEEFENFKPS